MSVCAPAGRARRRARRLRTEVREHPLWLRRSTPLIKAVIGQVYKLTDTREAYKSMITRPKTPPAQRRHSTDHHESANVIASCSTRCRQRAKLGDSSAATLGRHDRRPNSRISDAYVGPTEVPLLGRGTRPSRISLRRDFRARLMISCFGSGSESGFRGTLLTDTPRKSAIASRSASSQDSSSATATRNTIRSAGTGSHSRALATTQSSTLSRSTKTNQGMNLAA